MSTKKEKKTITSITLDDLAGMVKRGFDEMSTRFAAVDERFNRVDKRFDRLENLILPDHQRRIEHLEVDMKRMKDIFALK